MSCSDRGRRRRSVPGARRMRLTLVIGALLVTPAAGDERLPGESQQGWAQQRPATGRFVKTSAAYLVPYTQAIPGSDVTFEMVPIVGGRSTLGSAPDEPGHHAEEGPRVAVELKPFWIGQYEVTWGEYRQYMRLTPAFERFDDLGLRAISAENRVDAITSPSKLYDPTFTFASGDDPRMPAVSMSQYAAKQYTKWLSLLTGVFYRLPSEAEWEHACRAGRNTAYAFGDDHEQLARYGWYVENADGQSHRVGLLKANAWGLNDMHGNVAEWVLDEYLADSYARWSAKPEPRRAGVRWPTRLYPRVLRGGSWTDPAERCRCAARGRSDDDEWRSEDPNSPQSPWWFASDESQDVGFRIVRPVEPPPRGEWNRYWEADIPVIQRVVDHRIDQEGRGERGLVDPSLPAAIERLPAAP